MNAVPLPRCADSAGRWAAIAIGFTIPISVALDNALLLLVLAGWLAGGNYAQKWSAFRNNAVSLCALALFGLLLAGAFHGGQPAADARQYLVKYLDLAFIPLFVHFFREPAARRHGLLALAAALALVLALSFMIKFGIIESGQYIEGTPASPLVFKLRVTHSFLMAFGAFLFAWMAVTSAAKPARVAWGVLALLATANVTLLVEGATGYLILGVLALLLAFSLLPRRIAFGCLLAIPLIVAALLATPGPFSQRAITLAQEIQSWRPDAAARGSSAGFRLEFYRNTAGIIADHPVAGVGTGGFPSAYADRVRGTAMVATRNPHNEYLHIAAQTGLIGLAALLFLFAVEWRSAKPLPTPMEVSLARGLVLAMAMGCMFNSLLLDHAEGLFHAWLAGLLYAGLKPGAVGSRR